MRTEPSRPANELHAPGTRARIADPEAARARLDRLLADPVVQRIIGSDCPPRELMIRTARAAHRQIAEARTRR